MFGVFETRRERDRKFDEIFWEKRFLVEAIAKRYARTPDLVDDLVQEIFLRVYLNLPAVLGAENQDAYLRRLAVNSITDYFRTHRDKANEVTLSPELAEIFPASADGSETTLVVADQARQFMEMIHSFPHKRRYVMILRIVEGLSFREIGKTLGISEVSARNLFSLGMKQLKKQALRRREVRYA